MISCFVVVPWLWVVLLAVMAFTNIKAMQKILKDAFRLSAMQMMTVRIFLYCIK